MERKTVLAKTRKTKKYIQETKEYEPIYRQTNSGNNKQLRDWEFNKYNGKNTREYYVFKNGTRAMMPRYYRDKIYSDEEKELLWLQKLDKGETWVMGEKCKIDSDEYKNLLSYYREQAKQIHGDNIGLWKEKQYWRRLEKQRNIYRKRKHMGKIS